MEIEEEKLGLKIGRNESGSTAVQRERSEAGKASCPEKTLEVATGEANRGIRRRVAYYSEKGPDRKQNDYNWMIY